MKRIGVLTSGGDAPGMNTAVRAVVRTALHHGLETYGVHEGYAGLLAGKCYELKARDVGDILHRGGTFLQTARCAEMHTDAGLRIAVERISESRLDGVVVIGGDGSLAGAYALHSLGVPTVGIPASIDNDIWGTNMSIGVDTALNTIMETVDKLRDTASSHQRAFLIETMGRNCGYLALMAGVVCGAEFSLIPEVDVTLEEVADAVAAAYARGKSHSMILVAEGASLDIREVARYLDERELGYESRITILGHVQRGGTPTAFDRLLATRLGVAAVDALVAGDTGIMTALTGREISRVPLEQTVAQHRAANLMFHDMTKMLAR
jgi:6-phosphofructokinase 1